MAQLKKTPLNIAQWIDRAERQCAGAFAKIDAIERVNTAKVLSAFQKHRISARHFAPTTGYGYDDIGRDTLSALFAQLMGCEAAMVRPQIASGTHALALCLFGVLRPGDVMLSAAGKPYDTLEQVIGIAGNGGEGSLCDYGIGYRQVDLKEGRLDWAQLELALADERVKLVLLQRSRGYDWRPSLTIDEIAAATALVRRIRPQAVVMVDNCYGEFTGEMEPGSVGVDLLAGSLIKNPGGGLAPTGGYIAGKSKYVDLAACRLTAPGVGGEVGSYAGSYLPFYQGLFLAPHVVAQAVKSAVLAAQAMSMAGFPVRPDAQESRTDIIQAIQFPSAESLICFVQAIQAHSPIDSEAIPEPWEMPGYQDPVIMAAGTFVAGASIELSADAPIRPPYIAYLQGALTYAHGRLGLEGALTRLWEQGFLPPERFER